MRTVSRPALALIVVVVVVVALFSPIRLEGRSAGAVPGWNTYEDQADGLTMSFPSGWTMAAGNLTPNLINPRELVEFAYANKVVPSISGRRIRCDGQ